MEINQLIADFAVRHNVEDLVAVDGAASLDIDGMIINIVANGEVLTLSAEIGEPPPEGAGAFSDLLLEANLQPGAFFAKAPRSGAYLVVRRLSLTLLDDATFDSELETFVNNVELWRRLLSDFRPMAKTEAEAAKAAPPSFGASGFMQV